MKLQSKRGVYTVKGEGLYDFKRRYTFEGGAYVFEGFSEMMAFGGNAKYSFEGFCHMNVGRKSLYNMF